MGASGMSNLPSVLLGWELGGGFGHATSLVFLANRLKKSGLAPVLAVKDWLRPHALFLSAECPVVPAPSVPHERRPFRARSYTDILAVCGFSTIDKLLPLVSTWQGLIDTIKPTVIVADHAPSLVLAAYGALPTVLVGNGFTVPPSFGDNFPTLDERAKATATSSELLEVVRQVQHRRRRSSPQTLPGLFAESRPFFYVFPELDPYRKYRNIIDAGPLSLSIGPVSMKTQSDFFAYLSAEDRRTVPAIETLVHNGMRGEAYLRDVTSKIVEHVRQLGVRVYDSLPNPKELLSSARVAVHHAGPGFAQDALVLGRPQLLLPRHLEQELTSQALAELGVATFAVGKSPKTQFTAAAQAVFTNEKFALKAKVEADRFATRGVDDWSHRFVDHCWELIRSTT